VWQQLVEDEANRVNSGMYLEWRLWVISSLSGSYQAAGFGQKRTS
jgi:hypothetical protein